MGELYMTNSNNYFKVFRRRETVAHIDAGALAREVGRPSRPVERIVHDFFFFDERDMGATELAAQRASRRAAEIRAEKRRPMLSIFRPVPGFTLPNIGEIIE